MHDGIPLQGRTPMRANLHMRTLATSHETCKARADAKSGSGRWVFGVVIQIGTVRSVGRCGVGLELSAYANRRLRGTWLAGNGAVDHIIHVLLTPH